MKDDINEIEIWAENFTDIKKLSATLTKHYLFHKKQVDSDIATLKTDYSD